MRKVMAGERGEGLYAIDHCPVCGARMPEPVEEDYKLAGTAPAGIWEESVKGLGTGYYSVENCSRCGASLFGWQYTTRDEPSCFVPVCHLKWSAEPRAFAD